MMPDKNLYYYNMHMKKVKIQIYDVLKYVKW